MNENVINGLGVFYWDDGQLYFGEWIDNIPTGKGILFFPHGGYL